MTPELIGTEQAAALLRISPHTVRDYKEKGLFQIAAKHGNHDRYDPSAIKRRWALIQKLRAEGLTLRQISEKLASEQGRVV